MSTHTSTRAEVIADVADAVVHAHHELTQAAERLRSLRPRTARRQRLEHILELAKRLEQIARDRFNAGDVPQLEVIQAGLEVARAQADHKVAQQEEKVSLSQLNALLNEPATTDWEPVESLEDLPAPSFASRIDSACLQFQPRFAARRAGAEG